MATPKIVAALICKNEEAMLARCLDSIKGVDAIYISDTGSADKTVEIAKKYTDKVWTEDLWQDSFCHARNFILDKVKEDFKGQEVYILSIDADEFLHDLSKVREAVDEATKKGVMVVDCKLIYEHEKQFHWYPRLFKMSPEIWWEGAAHNHISLKAAMTSGVEITYGFSPAHLLNPTRTLDILKKEVELHHNARETYYLGREYWYRQNYLECSKHLEDYVKIAHFLPEKADAYVLLARCYFFMGRGDEARQNCANALLINPHFKEACLLMERLAGRGTGNPIFEKNADQWKKMSETADNSMVLFVRDL